MITSIFEEQRYNRSISDNESMHRSTVYPELLSTTIKFCGDNFCFHCGESAKIVQQKFSHGYSYDYSTNGYRCTCDGAIDEIIDIIAHDVCDIDWSPYTRVDHDIIDKILKKSHKRMINTFDTNNTVSMKIENGYASMNHFKNETDNIDLEYNNSIQLFLKRIQVKAKFLIEDKRKNLNLQSKHVDELIKDK